MQLIYFIGLAKKSFEFFYLSYRKNTNELWANPINTIVNRTLKANGKKKVKVKSLSSVQLVATPWT